MIIRSWLQELRVVEWQLGFFVLIKAPLAAMAMERKYTALMASKNKHTVEVLES